MKLFIKALCFLIVCSKSHQNNLISLEKSIDGVIANDHLISNDCMVHMKMFKQNLIFNGSWASKMLQSWSNLNPNLNRGNFFDFGDFDGCINIRHKSDDFGLVRGQYCLVQYYSTSNQTLRNGSPTSILNKNWKQQNERFGGAICIPSSCPPEMVTSLLSTMFNETTLRVADEYQQKDYCKVFDEDQESFKFRIAFACFTFALIFICTISTLYDKITTDGKLKYKNKLLMSFSLKENVKKLLSSEQSLDEIACIHGIRVFSILCIFLHHAYVIRLEFPMQNPEEEARFLAGWFGSTVGQLSNAVDSFFVISGLLTTRAILKDLDVGQLHIFTTFFKRYMRLTPTLVFVCLLSMSLNEYSVLHAPYSFYLKACEDYWGSMLMHLQVYTNPDRQCMLHSWYLAVDWQMFLIAPLLVYLVWKFGNKYIWLIVALIVASNCNRFMVAYQNRLFISDIKMRNDSVDVYMAKMYFQTHLRGSAYLIGMVFGFFLHGKLPKIFDRWFTKTLMWIITISCITITFFSDPNENQNTSLAMNSLLLATFRDIWAISISWIILTTHSHSWSWITNVMSHKPLISFGRLGLCFYLVHPIVLAMTTMTRKQPILFTQTGMLINVFSDFLLTFAFSILVHLFVEAPFTQFGRVLSRCCNSNKIK